MKESSDNQLALSLAIAQEISKSHLSIEECLDCLSFNLGALIGRHAPNQEQLLLIISEVDKAIHHYALYGFHNSDIYPNR